MTKLSAPTAFLFWIFKSRLRFAVASAIGFALFGLAAVFIYQSGQVHSPLAYLAAGFFGIAIGAIWSMPMWYLMIQPGLERIESESRKRAPQR